MSLSQHMTKAVRSGRMPHAVLLTGGSGSKLREMALLLAAAYNCEAPIARRPCCERAGGASGNTGAFEDGGVCLPCRKTMNLLHPDVTVLDCAEGNVPVERIRGLCATLPVLPGEGRFKPYIIYDAQLLSTVCQNALLAALEEPPGFAAFLLTCDRPGALLPTVRSRLTRWDMSPAEAGAAEDKHGEELQAHTDAILSALDGGNELALLTAALGCSSLNREQAASLLDRIRSALIDRALDGGVPEEVMRLTDAADALGDLQETLSRNAGLGHLFGAMAVRLAGTFR